MNGNMSSTLTFSRRKLNANFGKFNFFTVKAAVKFSLLKISKRLNTNTKRIFPIPFELMYISLRYTVSRSGYLYVVNKATFPSKCFSFQKL